MKVKYVKDGVEEIIDIDEIVTRLESDAHAVSIQVLNHH